jgi:signal transduction histidine kinase
MHEEDLPALARDVEAMLALAHALRTPLTSLALGLGLLDDGALGSLNDGQREVVHTLVGEVARLTLLTERHLDTGRLGAYAGPVERVRVDLAELVRQAAVPIERQASDRGVRMVLTLARGVVVVADPVKLAWVAVSLMGNALRYSPPGADIDVEVTIPQTSPPDPLSLAGEGGIPLAHLSVHDRGPGLAPEVVPHIFDRDGGPALFLAREIVEAHGGSIAVTAAPGRGSTFTITLPAAHGGPGPEESA